jgi:hypothetical protein
MKRVLPDSPLPEHDDPVILQLWVEDERRCPRCQGRGWVIGGTAAYPGWRPCLGDGVLWCEPKPHPGDLPAEVLRRAKVQDEVPRGGGCTHHGRPGPFAGAGLCPARRILARSR